MSTLEFTDYEILSAELYEENRMPDIGNVRYIRAKYSIGDNVSAEDARYIGKGMINTLLPYTLQDHYGRERKTRAFHAAILENDKLRAVFLPELGGRLWSLYHKGLQRELLYVNPVYQPANLALRNAWFSGGVEFNIGIRGHNPLTCSPMHAVRMEAKDGTPVLRMYEYERIRGVAYRMDFTLPEGSETLFMRVTIENTEDKEKYMYWWSNIAVPETPDTRILAPCDSALQTFYREGCNMVDTVSIPHPMGDGFDCSYPAYGPKSRDYFFRIPKEHAKWVAAAEKDGRGLLQFSTHELRGRKLFLWGRGRGGRNWNRWLCGEDKPYIEIQAGLAQTQYEHIPMAAKSTFTWVEGYTALNCEPDKLHGDYSAAIGTVDAYLAPRMPAETEMHALFEGIKPVETLMHGSGWGCVENLLRKACCKAPVSTELPFEEASIGKNEALWHALITTGEMPEQPLDEPPASHFVSPDILPLMENQIKKGKAHAALYLHYGTALYANERTEEAYAAYEKSAALKENAWAYRNLSMLEKNERGNMDKALVWMRKALAVNKSDRGLILNAAQLMLAAERYEEWTELFANLDDKLRGVGRLQLYTAIALIRLARYEEAAGIVNADFVLNDIEEGEVSLSAVWFDLYRHLVKGAECDADENTLRRLVEEQYPLPMHLDFRMS